MFPVFAALIFASSTQQTVKQDFTVHHLRPSKVLTVIMYGGNASSPSKRTSTGTGEQGLIPQGVTVKADDEGGVLTIEGPRDKVVELGRAIPLFDIEKRKVVLNIEVVSPLDKYSSKTETAVPTATPWGMVDGDIELKLEVTPQVNEDGTITCLVKTEYEGEATNLVGRFRTGENMFLVEKPATPRTGVVPARHTSWTYYTGGAKLDFDPGKSVVIHVTAKILEVPNRATANPIHP